MELLIGSFQGLRGLTQVRYPRSLDQAITSLCAVAWVLCTAMRSLPETCNTPFVPIRNMLNPITIRKIQMQTTLATSAVGFFLWVNPTRGGR
jgi:hypothetical protein